MYKHLYGVLRSPVRSGAKSRAHVGACAGLALIAILRQLFSGFPTEWTR